MPRIQMALFGVCALVLSSPGCDAPRKDVSAPPSTSESASKSDSNSDPGLWFFVLVKSSNYSQGNEGELTFLNYHFFSEIFPKGEYSGPLKGQLTRHDAQDSPMPYENRETNYYIEGGHFDSLSDLDSAYPNGDFVFEIASDALNVKATLSLSGPEGKTDIPAPITIALFQNGQEVRPDAIDPTDALTIRWSEYSNGRPDPNGIVDDMIFVVIQNCHGDRIVHTGLPFRQSRFLTYRAKELAVDSGAMDPGQPYAMFVEFPHVVDSVVAAGVPGFTSYATATYLDIHTTGEAEDASCLEEMPAMDTGQTDRQ